MKLLKAIWEAYADHIIWSNEALNEYRALQENLKTEYHQFKMNLSKDQCLQLLRLEADHNFTLFLEEETYFYNGFLLGARFMADILNSPL